MTNTIVSIGQSICAGICGLTEASRINQACVLSPSADSEHSELTKIVCPTDDYASDDTVSPLDCNSVSMRTLTHSDFDEVHRCLCEGFSTDTVKVEMPHEELSLKLDHNSYQPNISVGIFHGNAMVGFWLSAIRTVEGGEAGFGVGSTVLDAWRRRGLAQIMIRAAVEVARGQGAAEYRLLVGGTNAPAIDLYEKMGFAKSGGFMSFDTHGFNPDFKLGRFRIISADVEKTLKAGASMSKDEQSWYNMDEGIRATSDSHITALALDEDGEESGYGIFQPQTGRISRLGVRSMDREREIAAIRGILSFFHRHAPEDKPPEIFQVHEKSSRIFAHLDTLGFRPRTVQHEMSKKL
jgi:ribosomal protein S18 acetylase RimI-like enzyme